MSVKLHGRTAKTLVACVFLAACASGTGQTPKVSNGAREVRIGWLHGNCLALDAADVRIGSEVAVLAFGDADRVVSARISGRADDADTCPPLLDDRMEANVQEGQRFYLVDADAPVELGIGVLQSGGSRTLTAEGLLDTDGDGRRDSFSHCTTSEGVRFSVWADEAHRGEPLWAGYYYLGYDTEPDCPREPGG